MQIMLSDLFKIVISCGVIRALILIFKPAAAWDRILEAQRGTAYLLLRYMLPMMLIVAGVEGFGMVFWGKYQTALRRIQKFTVGETVVYESARFMMMALIIVSCAVLIKMFGETFRGRHTYRQTFTLVIYGLGPLFLLRLLDVTPMLSPWITWGIGIVLCTEVIYQGIPRVMEPDPPNAFGLYFMSSLVLVATTGLERFATAWFLQGRMRPVKDIIDEILGHLSG
jgi:hypothetical protein